MPTTAPVSVSVPAPTSGADRVAAAPVGPRETGPFGPGLDPDAVAQSAAVANLLRCWVREAGLSEPADGLLRIPLAASGTALTAPVHHWSPTGLHRFGPARLACAPDPAPPVDAVTVAALLAREVTGLTDAPGSSGSPASPGPLGSPRPSGSPGRSDLPGPSDSPGPSGSRESRRAPRSTSGPDDPGPSGLPHPAVAHGHAGSHGTDLVARVADSVRRTAVFLRDRREHPRDVPDRFLAAEQALLLGHPLHPAPKSRQGVTDTEARRYAPELRGSFRLHWLSVAPHVLATDSAWTERGRPVPAALLTARLAGAGPALPDGHAALPLHPWQYREVRHRPEVRALMDAGLLTDLGVRGDAWHPTSSLRTVQRGGAPAMLKLSLALDITNSRRENLRKELHRGVEVHRLLRTGLSRQWQAAHPGFDIVRDPAWLAVDGTDGNPVRGLDVVIRHNPFRPTDEVACVAGLVAPRLPLRADAAPGDGPAAPSLVAEGVPRLSARPARPRGAVAAEWFLRYLEHVVRPVLWLDAMAGIALEAHQQNTLLLLDADGWPAGGRHRDNQGYYFRASRRAELDARLPGIGARSDTFVSDEVTDERFAYYLAVNNVFGLIGAFGSQRLADERLLLAAFRRFLAGLASGPAPLRGTLPGRLLDSPVLRCKANLLTRLHGLDELVGPVDTQSVYVTIANPLHS